MEGPTKTKTVHQAAAGIRGGFSSETGHKAQVQARSDQRACWVITSAGHVICSSALLVLPPAACVSCDLRVNLTWIHPVAQQEPRVAPQ